jgi:CubicO group peptidase (beta-lactamase class C family)
MKTFFHVHIYIILLIGTMLLVFLTSCGSEPVPAYSYRLPEQKDDGFEVGSLAQVNMDVNLLESAVDEIQGGSYGEIHSLLIYKDGNLVFEEYFPGHDYQWDVQNFHGNWVDWDVDRRHNIHSAGKSITSACIGIAIEQGYIENVDQSMFDYLPEHQNLNTGGKDQITIEHLLTMTSGLEWDEWGTSYSDENNDVIALWFDCDDPITCILEKPLISEPGTKFNYSGGNMIILGEIIKNATGMDIDSFSWQYLFEPLGIETPPWRWIEDTGVIYAGGDQHLTSREMLKFGVTYLNGGVWNEQQIIPEGWVEKSATPYSGPENHWLNSALKPIPPGDDTWGQRGYAYTWWTHEFSHAGKKIPAYWAFGWGGQKIVIFPDQNAVIVLTGGSYIKADATSRILTKYVIPAMALSID